LEQAYVPNKFQRGGAGKQAIINAWVPYILIDVSSGLISGLSRIIISEFQYMRKPSKCTLSPDFFTIGYG
jgi:hypothetical protein